MFLSLKTLYRKRTVIWPFTFTQLYGLYQDLMNDLKSKSNIKLMKRVLTTYELRKYLKNIFVLH